MAHYRYVFLSLRDEQVIQEIDMYGVYIKRLLNDPGQFNGTFQFDQTGKQNIDLVAATTPGKTWLVVERNDVPIWCGIVWSRTYQSQSKSCQIYAWGFEAFPRKQKIDVDFTRSTAANTQIFCDLWSTMQSTEGRNMNVNVPYNISGPLHDLTVLASDNNYFNDPMDALASAADGFDYTIDIARNNDGTYNKSLRVGYPNLGTSSVSPDIITFEYPGSILNYYSSESMADAGTYVYTIGAGEGSSMPTVLTVQQEMIDVGWPRWDVDATYKDVSDTTILNQIAQQEQIVRKPPMPTFSITIKGESDPAFGSYNLGDACQLSITDPRYPSTDGAHAGLIIPSVVLGWELTPSSADNVEEVTVTLPGDTVNG
jgi:hypothetical protein